jgi:hypothetical protein
MVACDRVGHIGFLFILDSYWFAAVHMVIVRLKGRLGKQLFQFAFGESLRHRTGRRVHYAIGERRDFLLEPFRVDINPLPWRVCELAARIARQLSISVSRHEQMDIVFEEPPTLAYALHYFDGFWQSEKYFKCLGQRLRDRLLMAAMPLTFNQRFVGMVSECDTVGIHVRRGDYANSGAYKLISGNYYWRAIGIIRMMFPSARFFIFSDDIPACRVMFKSLDKSTFVEGSADKGYDDLRLMMMCKHNIIGNSTFSWWAAWLNQNPNKVVVSPANWFNSNDRFRFNMSDLLPDDWIKLDVD